MTGQNNPTCQSGLGENHEHVARLTRSRMRTSIGNSSRVGRGKRPPNNDRSPRLTPMNAKLELDIDISLLDFKSPDDFLSNYRSKVEHIKLLGALTRQLKLARALLTIPSYLTATSSSDDIIHRILDVAKTILNVENVLLLKTNQSGDLTLNPGGGAPVLPAGHGIEGDVLSKRKSSFLNDISLKDDRHLQFYNKLHIQPRGIMCAPLVDASASYGVLVCINKQSDGCVFTPCDVHALEVIASYIMLLITRPAATPLPQRLDESAVLLGELASKLFTSALTPSSVLEEAKSYAKSIAGCELYVYTRLNGAITMDRRSVLGAAPQYTMLNSCFGYTSTHEYPIQMKPYDFLIHPVATAVVFPLTTDKSDDVMIAARTQSIPFTPKDMEILLTLSHFVSHALYICGLHSKETAVAPIETSQLKASCLSSIINATGKVLSNASIISTFFGFSPDDIKQDPLPKLLMQHNSPFSADISTACSTGQSVEKHNVDLTTPRGVRRVDYFVFPYTPDSAITSIDSEDMTAEIFIVMIRYAEGERRFSDVTVTSFRSDTTDTDNDHSSLITPIRKVTLADNDLLKGLFTWEYNVLALPDKAMLLKALHQLFDNMVSLSTLNIPLKKFENFLVALSENYHSVPFHNFYHATCVTHFTYMLINNSDKKSCLSNYQIFAIMLSATAHDVDHPGNTNMFEINKQSELAILYNDTSVLEHHHCATTFKLMHKAENNIFQNMSFTLRSELRKIVISSILATDMMYHVTLVEEMAKRNIDWEIDTFPEQQFFGKILVHAADLSNPVRPFHLAKEWASKVSEEFNHQGRMEKTMGLPVSTFLLTPDTKSLAKNEAFFSEKVVAPMWRGLAALFPNFQHLVDQIDSNIDTWKSLLEKLS